MAGGQVNAAMEDGAAAVTCSLRPTRVAECPGGAALGFGVDEFKGKVLIVVPPRHKIPKPKAYSFCATLRVAAPQLGFS